MINPPQPCDTCRHRCPCNVEKGEFCGHYGCPGRPEDQDSTCPGAILEIARYQAQCAAEDARTRIFRMRRMANSHTYALNVARAALRDYGDVEAAVAEQCPPVEP